MKKIYLVRHGQCQADEDGVMQNFNTPLSKKGRQQSKQIGLKLKKLNFDLLISSPLKRTVQTAELIKKYTKKDFSINELFIERIRPSSQYDLKKNSKLNVSIEREFQKYFLDGKKYKDAESFWEVKKRAEKALKYLEKEKAEKIVVVTHGTFSRVLAGLILIGKDELNPKNCFKIAGALKKTNTGISLFQKEKNWRIVSWNDFSHFDQERESGL